MNFNLKAPCGNCPFKRVGAIELMRGRLLGIVETLSGDDHQCFPCHKTTFGPKGGDWDDESGVYKASGHESACMGALAFQRKLNHLPVLARIGIIRGELTVAQLDALAGVVIDPTGAML